MRPARLLLLCALALLLAIPAVAQARAYDITAALGARLASVAAKTDVPVRVPRTLDLDYDGRLHTSGTGSRRAYSFDLAAAPGFDADVCSLASSSGERGGTPASRRTVALRGGRTGYFKPLTCGGSCAPPMIQWRQGGVLYSIEAKIGRAGRGPQQAAMVAAANSAIAAPAR